MIIKALNFRKKNIKEILKEKRKFQNKFRKGKVKKIMNYYFEKNNYS